MFLLNKLNHQHKPEADVYHSVSVPHGLLAPTSRHTLKQSLYGVAANLPLVPDHSQSEIHQENICLLRRHYRLHVKTF